MEINDHRLIGGSEIVLSERRAPSTSLPRVAQRWDIPPIDERTVEVPQIFEGVRSKIVTTPFGERVLWGNRQATLILEETVAMLGKRRLLDGATLPLKYLNEVVPAIVRMGHGFKSLGGDARGIFGFATNLATVSADSAGGVVGYVDADDTRTNAEVRVLEMHEVGVHVVQTRIGGGTIKILPAALMRGDPDYQQIGWSEVGRIYLREPKRLAAEALAYILSGEWDKVGYTGVYAMERASGFADRHLRAVARLYGVEAVKQFRDIHPEMSASVERISNEKEVIENVNSYKPQGTKTRSTGRTNGPGEGGFSASEGARSIGEREREGLGESLRGGWRGSGEESAQGTFARSGEAKSSGELNPRLGSSTSARGSYLCLLPGSFREEGIPVPPESQAGHPDLQSRIVIQGQAAQHHVANVSQASQDIKEVTTLPATVSPEIAIAVKEHQRGTESKIESEVDTPLKLERPEMSAPAGVEVANRNQSFVVLERPSPDNNHAQEQSVELDYGEDHSFSF